MYGYGGASEVGHWQRSPGAIAGFAKDAAVEHHLDFRFCRFEPIGCLLQRAEHLSHEYLSRWHVPHTRRTMQSTTRTANRCLSRPGPLMTRSAGGIIRLTRYIGTMADVRAIGIPMFPR